MTTGIVGMTGARYTCPCCGYIVFDEPPGSYDICPICFWEDDALQLEFADTLAGGANGVTLVAAQATFASLGACEGRLFAYVRPPGPDDHRDPAWRPIDTALDSFPRWDASPPGSGAPRVPPEGLYYWHPAFWYRPPVT